MDLTEKTERYLKTLCKNISERCVGSEGNRAATRFFAEIVSSFGWKTEMPEFPAIDWVDGGAQLHADNTHYELLVSPYSPGCDVAAELIEATTVDELEQIACGGKILLLSGAITKEQLMPKNFVFYNPDEHRKIIALLEKSSRERLSV
jgi:aminopeptidase YwaD